MKRSLPEDLSTNPFIQSVAALEVAVSNADLNAAGLPRGTVRGRIVDVDDPKNRGRVRVIFDDMNPEIPQVTGAGEWSAPRVGLSPDISHWIDTSPAFYGKQPPGLVGKRVNIVVSGGQYQYAILQDVTYDPQLLASGKMKRPDNSSMTRLPIYPAGKLPPARKENHGCIVIEEDGPMDSDWLCICLKRNGEFIWVRHVDLQHGHAGENDGQQPPDGALDSEQPVDEQSVWDYVFPTSQKEMPKSTAYSKEPRPNPYGDEARWHEPPT